MRSGQRLTGLPPHDVARLGVYRTFQNVQLFGSLSVVENVMVAGAGRHPDRFMDALLGPPRPGRGRSRSPGAGARLLALVGIEPLAFAPAASLPFGQQRLVEVARALAGEPALLLLDEPAAGLNSTEKVEMMRLIGRLRELGLAVLLIEHDMRLVMGVSDRVVVLNYGEKIADGSPAEVQADRAVVRSTSARRRTALLEVTDVVTRYGAVEALRGVSLSVRAGELVCLLGANGAGKSTLLKSIVGLLPPARGRVVFEGVDVTGRSPDVILRAGIALVPERRRVFGALSVRDNLLLGGYAQPRADAGLEEVQQLFPVLRARASQLAGTLSGGEQQMLAIGRALMGRPRLLLCDEPSLGLAPLVTQEIMRLLAALPARGTTVLLVEQNAGMALRIAQRGYVLETGMITLEGPAADLLGNAELKAAYLGG